MKFFNFPESYSCLVELDKGTLCAILPITVYPMRNIAILIRNVLTYVDRVPSRKAANFAARGTQRHRTLAALLSFASVFVFLVHRWLCRRRQTTHSLGSLAGSTGYYKLAFDLVAMQRTVQRLFHMQVLEGVPVCVSGFHHRTRPYKYPMRPTATVCMVRFARIRL